MDISYELMLIGAILLLISIIATAFSSRIGMPLLLIFLGIGMFAGEQGPGKIIFSNIQNAHFIGTLALAIILFDAGLHTKMAKLRAGLWPAISLSSIGILLTALCIGLLASWLLQLSWLEGLLIGAIIAPTDAAAVFCLLENQSVKLTTRLTSILEIESGCNDPIAVLLTISLVKLLQTGGNHLIIAPLLKDFLLEITIGLFIGVIAGRLVSYLINSIKLIKTLYPLLVFASGMLIFATTNLIGGSGYLAIYLAGIVIGNSSMRYQQSSLNLHASLAWLSQISMFLMLGLLVVPSALLANIVGALIIALALIFIVRPIAVMISLLPFKFTMRERLFIAWVGLRGAVPIILALNPLLVGLNHASLYFNVIFFIVIISVVLQGWTLRPVAAWLKLKVN